MSEYEWNRRDVLRSGVSVVAGMLASDALRAQPETSRADRLWYTRPADEWVQALPIGNGRIGAMVFGGVASERLQLNEDSFFSGGPYDPTSPSAHDALPLVRELIFSEKYADAQKIADANLIARPPKQMSYQTIGDLRLTFPGIENSSEYLRELNLPTAVARTQFSVGATSMIRSAFASAVDQVIVVRLACAPAAKRVTTMIGFETPQNARIALEGGNTLVMSGVGPADQGVEGAVRFEARAQVLAQGGTVKASDSGIFVLNADEVMVLVAIATNYRGPSDLGADPAALNQERLAAAARYNHDTLLARHVADFQPKFARVSLDLGATESAALPTDERVRRYAMSRDPALVSLYFQFGRYLLLCSSRGSGQPANLQGIWNEKTNPSWGSKWTLNINAEMNYWPAGSAALGECVEPLLRMTQQLAISGARLARDMYGARGWVAHHNTDLWRAAAPVDGAFWGLWPMGGAWLTLTLWDHWEFTRDRGFLGELYPLLKGCCEFFMDTLAEHPREKLLVTNPSLSPENRHPFGSSLCAGPAMDSQMLRDLFARTGQAATLLGVDADFRGELERVHERLPRDRIGKAGQLQEWLEDWDMEAPEINHRHVSHLYALFPSGQITPEDTPSLAAAARRSLEIRGDESTGWGIAWRLNLWARLADGNRVHDLLRLLLSPQRTYPNLFDAHPPFQIDGNFGATSAVAELLLQSHRGRLQLLPALPRAWPQGRISGVRARGGFELDIRWSAGQLESVLVTSVAGESTILEYRGASVPLTLKRGASRQYVWVGDKLKVVRIGRRSPEYVA